MLHEKDCEEGPQTLPWVERVPTWGVTESERQQDPNLGDVGGMEEMLERKHQRK